MRARTFSFAAEPLEPAGVPAHVPCPITHPRADVTVTAGPRVIASGVAVLAPLGRMLFWPGYVTERAMAPISERHAVHVLDEIEARALRLVALSGHDTMPWTFSAFPARLGSRYRTLRG